MEDPNQHPADQLIDAFHGLINGDAIKQGLRDAWDRITGGSAPQSDHDKAVQQMNDNLNAHKNDAANQSFIKPDVAAKIRKQASK